MSPLQQLLTQFREQTLTERDKGTSFEKLMVQYFKTEPCYKEKYQVVYLYGDWVEQYGEQLGITHKKDTGIDLVAVTKDDQHHAIQCKNYGADKTLQKADIDSFFTASGKSYFSYRIIITTTDKWSKNASESLENQNPPVAKIDLFHLENSVIDWAQYLSKQAIIERPKYDLRPHQQEAHDNVINGLKDADRGKLIMACGTGKTFTSLRIAETMAGVGKQVLFLVPSLSLLSQTLTEWTQQGRVPLNSFAVCSDSDVGKKHNADDDMLVTGVSDLQYPATTNAPSLAKQLAAYHNSQAMTVVFSTYHSIAVLNQAQQAGMAEFDLIICDEAHRTTGATFTGEDESAFVRVHNNAFIQGKKRLYMTATPRIYSDDAKGTDGVQTLYSMDDENVYGKELHVINFSSAVQQSLLVDYKVIVLAVEEKHVSRRLQDLLKDQNNSLKVDDAAKIVGCWKALSKQGLFEGDQTLSQPMKRAVAFCQVIEKEFKGKNHKVSSKQIAEMFGAVVATYQAVEQQERLTNDQHTQLPASLSMICEAEHVDGSMNATEKESKLQWLKAETDDNICRILSNVRCLSEGVDVPALDAVLFLTPRSSQVDVVQSVGRVMRKAKGKELGYVILPVVIPAGIEPEEALNNNETYRVVWQVLNALRSHDDRFDAMINKLEFTGTMPSKMEVVAVADNVLPKQKAKNKTQKSAAKALGSSIGVASDLPNPSYQHQINFEVGQIERALYAKIVKKCGNRFHWEDWANDIAKIANTHIDRIKVILENDNNSKERQAFDAFASELRDDLNNSISDEEIIEMLAQHLITKPVFEALFKDYNFAAQNPISKAMQDVVTTLEAHHIDKEANTLKSFYDSVKMRADGIESAEGKQRIIVELYNNFFEKAFPRLKDRLGIVYTPVEVVDFIIRSVEDVLNDEFGTSLADKNVHIIDPFTGTGTFITRLLQSGIIPTDKLPHKFKHEIHANEIVLLAYYIAAINIEAAYHGIISGNVTGREQDSEIIFGVDYEPFEGICLTDTFQMYESEDMIDVLLEENSARRKRQKQLDIRVIIGNPPYSIGQTSENDNNANLEYHDLDERIRTTYVARSKAVLSKGMYDSYIRSIRWASDRIGEQGVIGFVTNGGFLEANTADGMRKCLAEEFSNLYVFHLRGNARTSGELRRKERDNIFGMGTRTPVVASILVKNPNAKEHGKILFHDIGDYLTRDEKLSRIADFASIKGIPEWQTITPDAHGDWLSQRDDSFAEHIALGDKSKHPEKRLFDNFSLGVATNRDAWVYNSSRNQMVCNMEGMITKYNLELERFNAHHPGLDRKARQSAVDNFIDADPTKISWTRALKQELAKNSEFEFEDKSVFQSLYRPFTKQWMYFNRRFNEMVYQQPRIFPTADAENLVIQATGVGAKTFSVLISNYLPCLDNIEKGQCFPLYLYDEQAQESNGDLFADQAKINEAGLKRRDAITDEGLAHFQQAYSEQAISKEDLFYYVYGILHSEDYRQRFEHNLSKELPRIPRVKTYTMFKAFSDAGRKLADLHLNYETVEKYPVNITGKFKYSGGIVNGASAADFYVCKMKHGKKQHAETGKSVNDISKIIYNDKITLEEIPEQAYDYVVNGKSAIAWVMERQGVSTHKESRITNDANEWAIETMNNPAYPLELLQRVITVSLETMKIVNALPKLAF